MEVRGIAGLKYSGDRPWGNGPAKREYYAKPMVCQSATVYLTREVSLGRELLTTKHP